MGKAEDTQERILEAALAEFAAYGIAGARVDRIARSAACNKNLIYIYFESKEALFTTVLRRNLSRVYEEIAFTPDDLPGYAGRVFDFTMTHPELMRLMAWFGLEQGALASPSERREALADKLAALGDIQKQQPGSAPLPPAFLIVAIMSLATAWTSASPFGPSLDPEAHKHPDILRQNIEVAVGLLSGTVSA